MSDTLRRELHERLRHSMFMMTDIPETKLRRDTAALARRLARNTTHEADRERLFDIARELEEEVRKAEARDHTPPLVG